MYLLFASLNGTATAVTLGSKLLRIANCASDDNEWNGRGSGHVEKIKKHILSDEHNWIHWIDLLVHTQAVFGALVSLSFEFCKRSARSRFVE
jgi:hypothetical protein